MPTKRNGNDIRLVRAYLSNQTDGEIHERQRRCDEHPFTSRKKSMLKLRRIEWLPPGEMTPVRNDRSAVEQDIWKGTFVQYMEAFWSCI